MIDQATLDQWRVMARRDDWHTAFVGSDIRQMLGEIDRLKLLAYEPHGDNHHNALDCPYCQGRTSDSRS